MIRTKVVETDFAGLVFCVFRDEELIAHFREDEIVPALNMLESELIDQHFKKTGVLYEVANDSEHCSSRS